jgi:Xaa-Pro aminopeptidase
LKDTGIELMKERVHGAVSLEDWITANLKPGNRVAVDGLTVSAAEAEQIGSKLAAKGISFNVELDLVERMWLNRPIIANKSVYEHPVNFAGKSRVEKIELVRRTLLSKKLDSTVISMLDDVAWLFNLRGQEIEYTPLFAAYGYIDQSEAWLFIHPDKITEELGNKLEKEEIKVVSYNSFFDFLGRIKNQRILIDPVRTNSLIVKYISGSNSIVHSVAVTSQIKAVKDANEIRNIRSAHIKDGAAMVYSLFWIYQYIENEKITEISVGNKLHEYRSKQPLFKDDSFHPVVGFGPHGAIVHYHATIQSDIVIEPDNLLLIDSGGQYLDGTTDITRTIGLGSVSQKQKEDFTACLKGHIALATAIFPEGTKGTSLDAIARKPLWDKGMNYGHGTGHGIGYFLSVHEGPMSIRSEFNNEPIRENHLLSNEPGIYREGEYGIRIENLILCKKWGSNEFGDFLCFETLSFCPIDRKLIIKELLSNNEINWIDHYHETVYKELSPLITDRNVLEWLKIQCAPLNVPE